MSLPPSFPAMPDSLLPIPFADYSDKSTDDLRALAVSFMQANDYEGALPPYRCLCSRPDSIADSVELCRTLLRLERVEECYDACHFFIDKLKSKRNDGSITSSESSRLLEVYMFLGLNSISVDDYERSAEAFLECTKLGPRVARTWNNLGFALNRLQRFSEAIEPLQKARDLAPRDPLSYVNLGHANHGMERWRDAIPYYSEAISLGEEFSDPGGYVFRGTAELLSRTYVRRSMVYSHFYLSPEEEQQEQETSFLLLAESDIVRAYELDSNYRRLELFLESLPFAADDLMDIFVQMNPNFEAVSQMKVRVEEFVAERDFVVERDREGGRSGMIGLMERLGMRIRVVGIGVDNEWRFVDYF